MKNIVIAVLIMFLMVGTGVAIVDINVLGVYDRNGDFVIDAEERVALDIDIENSRIDFSESAYAGMLTTCGTIILTEDVERAAFGEKSDTEVIEVVITIVEPVITEPVKESIPPTVEEVIVFVGDDEEDDNLPPGYYVGVTIGILIVGISCFILLGSKNGDVPVTSDTNTEVED